MCMHALCMCVHACDGARKLHLLRLSNPGRRAAQESPPGGNGVIEQPRKQVGSTHIDLLSRRRAALQQKKPVCVRFRAPSSSTCKRSWFCRVSACFIMYRWTSRGEESAAVCISPSPGCPSAPSNKGWHLNHLMLPSGWKAPVIGCYYKLYTIFDNGSEEKRVPIIFWNQRVPQRKINSLFFKWEPHVFNAVILPPVCCPPLSLSSYLFICLLI